MVIINALPGIPSLSGTIAEILVKLSTTEEGISEEIALALLTMIGKLGFELLGENSLMDVTTGMSQLSDIEIPASFEQFSGCLQVIQSLLVKNPTILEIIKENYFSTHLTNFLQKATPEQLHEN